MTSINQLLLNDLHASHPRLLEHRLVYLQELSAANHTSFYHVLQWPSYPILGYSCMFGEQQGVWDIDVSSWCPSQIYYRFHDTQGKRWMIYLRWRHSDPWSAELLRCDEEGWRFPAGEDEWQDLLEEEIHIPGTITHYYRDYEFAFLMEYALDKVRPMFPDVWFPQ